MAIKTNRFRAAAHATPGSDKVTGFLSTTDEWQAPYLVGGKAHRESVYWTTGVMGQLAALPAAA